MFMGIYLLYFKGIVTLVWKVHFYTTYRRTSIFVREKSLINFIDKGKSYC
jgi:hypothetical protein